MCRPLYVVLPNVKRSEKIRTARMANAIRASRSSCSMARDFHVHSSPDAFSMLVLFLSRSCARDLSLNTRLSFPSPRDSVHLLAAFSTCLAHLRQHIFPAGRRRRNTSSVAEVLFNLSNPRFTRRSTRRGMFICDTLSAAPLHATAKTHSLTPSS